MSSIAPSKMTVAHGNVVSPANVQTVSYSSSVSPIAGFSGDNLKYPDPGRLFKFTVVSPFTPSITLTFASSKTVRAFGVVRHNISSSLPGTGGVTLSVNGTPRGATGALTGDQDVLMILDADYSGTTFLFTIDGGLGVSGSTFIGSVFIASKIYKMQTNPTDGLLETQRESSIIVQQTSGGTRRVLSAGDRDVVRMSFTTRRAKAADVNFYSRTIQELTERHKMIGVRAPWETTATGMENEGHFFGFVQDMQVRPRVAAVGDKRYDLTVNFIGV